MPPQPLQQLKEILAYGQLKLASKDDMALLLKSLLKIMKDMQDKSSKMMAECMKMMDIMKMDMGTMDTEMMKQSKDYAKQMVDKSMATLEAKMPTMPDLSGLDTRITALENEPEEIIPTIDDIEKDIPKLGTNIRDSLEILQGNERLDVTAIKGIDELEKKINTKIDTIPRGKGGGARASHATKQFPLIPNGVLKTFAVPKSISGVVFSSDFPMVLMENAGFTLNSTRTSLTLTTDNAPSSGSQLLFQYQEVFNT